MTQITTPSRSRHPLEFPPANACAVLTPYPIPAALAGKKVVNLGDGFILRAIERLIGRFPPSLIHSPRITPPEPVIDALARAPAVILAGANQLHDGYTVWPGLDASMIAARRLVFIPFGIGLHGEPGKNDGLSRVAREVLVEMHRHIEYSSWRCPDTLAVFERDLPQITSQCLMTGCPVLYDRPLLEGRAFSSTSKRVAVTVTERGDFMARETAVLDFAARHFPRSEKFLVLHQNYSPPSAWEPLRARLFRAAGDTLNPYQQLRHHALRRGFKIIAPRDADECLQFYDSIDVHVGSRLHAHLLCLSRAKRSALVPVDGRSRGMAAYLGHPLCSPETLEQGLGCDFEAVRANALASFATMQKFLSSIAPHLR